MIKTIKLSKLNIIKELARRDHYEDVFFKLHQRSMGDKEKLDSSPLAEGVSLKWCLLYRGLIIDEICKAIKQKQYFPEIKKQIIVKISNKERTIYLSNWIDKIFEATLANILQGALQDKYYLDSLYSYRKGFSSISAIKNCRQFIKESDVDLYYAKCDIKSYFDHINPQILIAKLKLAIPKQENYFWELLNEIVGPQFRTSNQSEITLLSASVPTGCSISCFIANFYLVNVDRDIRDNFKVFYSRYGDDLLIAHESENVVSNVCLFLEKQLSELNLKLNEKKLERGVFSSVIKNKPLLYLGFKLNSEGGLFLSDRRINFIKQEILEIARHSYFINKKLCSSKINLLQAIINSLNYYLTNLGRDHYFYDLIMHCDDRSSFKSFDKWLAKVSLRFIYGTSHDRVFKYCTYRKIRQLGLVSVLDMRNRLKRNKDYQLN